LIAYEFIKLAATYLLQFWILAVQMPAGVSIFNTYTPNYVGSPVVVHAVVDLVRILDCW